MATFRYTTVADVMRHLQDFAGSNLKASQVRQRRRAIVGAYQHMMGLRNWRYFIRHDRVQVAAPYSTGTITYDHTGGSSERLVTLNGGTWPDWAGRGTLLLNSVEYEVAARLSNTLVTLTETSNPGADVSSTGYALHNDRFLMPIDLVGIDKMFGSIDRSELGWTDPRDFLSQRQKARTTDRAKHYTLLGDTDTIGRLMLRLTPLPSEAIALDYSYLRRPRPLLFDTYKAGLVTTAATTTVNGSGVAWTANMAGSILRVSYATAEIDEEKDTGSQAFEQMAMPVPFVYEARIDSVTDADTVVVDTAIPALTSVRYEISDPIDMEPGAMLTAFLRCAEWQLGCAMRLNDADNLYAQYQKALEDAMSVDQRYNLHTDLEQPPVDDQQRRDASPVNLGDR